MKIEIKNQKPKNIVGGCQTLNSKSKVDYHVEGEVDPLYVHWFFDRARLKVMPEGSE